MSAIHPLVLAEIEYYRAAAERSVERLRSRRNSISTVGGSGNGRAIQTGKLLREAEAIAQGWRIVLAAALAEDGDDAVQEGRAHAGDVAALAAALAEDDPGPVVGYRVKTRAVAGEYVPQYRCMGHRKYSSFVHTPLYRADVEPGTLCSRPDCDQVL